MDIRTDILLTQKTFRILLDAMSHPGNIYRLGETICRGNGRYLMTILSTLLDGEVSFHVIGGNANQIESKVIQLTGALPTGIEAADFVIDLSGKGEGKLLKAQRGILEYPDKGATLISLIESFSTRDASGVTLRLTGPGIKNRRSVRIVGVSRALFQNLKEINSEFPLGVDAMLVGGRGQIMCIPRSTNIEVI